MHYRVTRKTNRRIVPGYSLIDSGAQYEDGTTYVTRTIAIGMLILPKCATASPACWPYR